MVTLVPIAAPTGTDGFEFGELTKAIASAAPSATAGTAAIPLLFFPEDKAPDTVYASIIDFDGGDATFLVNCPSKTCSTDFPERTIVQGDESWSEYVVVDETTTYRICGDTGSDDVVCGVQTGKNLKTAEALKDIKATSTYDACWGGLNLRVAQVTGGVDKMADEGEFDNNGLLPDADTAQKLLDFVREEASCSATSSASAPKKTSSDPKEVTDTDGDSKDDDKEVTDTDGDSKDDDSKDDESKADDNKDDDSKADENKDDDDSGAFRLSFSGGLMAFIAVSTVFAGLA